MADTQNKTVKKTLRLKTKKPAGSATQGGGDAESDIRDVPNAPVMANMGAQSVAAANPPTATAIVAVVTVLVFVAIVVLQLMEWMDYASPAVFPPKSPL